MVVVVCVANHDINYILIPNHGQKRLKNNGERTILARNLLDQFPDYRNIKIE